MRKVGWLAGVMLSIALVTGMSTASAENAKIAVVDYTVVINGSEPGKQANAQLAAFASAKQTEATEKGKNVETLKNELSSQADTLSPDEKKAKEDAFNAAFREYRMLVAQSNLEVQKKAAELRAGVMQDIKAVLAKIAQEDNYSLIADAATTPYYDKNIDISAKVIQRYNESKKQ